MISFVNSIEEIPKYSNARVVLIDDSLQSERAVIDWIEKALDSPYDRDNWDGFRDFLHDLQWLKDSRVILIHKSLPSLTAWDLHTYFDLLYEASSLWADKDLWLKRHRALWCLVDEELLRPADSYNYINFQVYFVVEDKPRIDFFLPGKFPTPKVKYKRAPATHIGDIFEIPLPENRKRYMQFVIVDSSQLGAWGVRVFKKDYATDEMPAIEKIVTDSVDFYCNTREIGRGVLYGLWTYYGKSTNLGNLNAMVFRTFDRGIHGSSPQRWRVWKASQEARYYRVLPRKYLKADNGGMCPPIWVLYRILSGRWLPVPNVIDDYKGASLIERLLGKEHIPEHLAPKK